MLSTITGINDAICLVAKFTEVMVLYCMVSLYSIMVLFIVLLFLPIFIFFLFQKYQTTKSSAPSPPGPRGLPLIGNLHQFDNSNPPRYLWELAKQYGPLMSLRLGFVPTLVVSSAKMAKEILKTHDIQCSNRHNFLGRQILSYNFSDLAFTPYNAYWREMRKICVVHLFNSNRVQQFCPIREDEVSFMIEKISKLSAAYKPVNLNEMIVSLSNTIICRLAFGKRYEDGGGERRRLHALLKETQAMLGGFFFSDYFPFMGWLDKLMGMSQRLQKNFTECDSFYNQLINDHLDSQRRGTEKEDVIDVLLQARRDSDLTWDHIKAVLMNIFVGGTDAISVTVVWAMTNLMKNPSAMRKTQEEIRYLIKNKGFVEEDDLERLQYLKAVVKETMRLQPPTPLIPRQTTERFIVDGYKIPSKTMIYINLFAIGRDPEAWDNPNEFDPERFMGKSSIDLLGQNFELIPFGSGRRICPAIHMAIATVELALANILYKFDWEMPAGIKNDDLDFDVLPGITMHKKNALQLMARPKDWLN